MSGQPHLDTYGPFVTWLIVEQGFTARAHRRHLLRESRERSSTSYQAKGEVRPIAAGICRFADRAGSAAADHDSPGGSAHPLRLEPFRRNHFSRQRGRGLREGREDDLISSWGRPGRGTRRFRSGADAAREIHADGVGLDRSASHFRDQVDLAVNNALLLQAFRIGGEAVRLRGDETGVFQNRLRAAHRDHRRIDMDRAADAPRPGCSRRTGSCRSTMR